MAVPNSGELSLGKIRQELQTANYAGGPFTSAATSLDDAENGTYATINTCSPFFPLSANPANMSEWYGYDHDAPCYNSFFAMTDGGNSIGQDMLYSNTKPYGTTTSTSRPNPLNQFTISFWVKRPNDTSSQGYIFGLYHPTLQDRLVINWFSYQTGGDGYSTIVLSYLDDAGGYFSSYCVLNDANNKAKTGVANTDYWNATNPGETNGFGYSLVTVVVDYNNWSTGDYVKWFWNDLQLTVPWNSGGTPTGGSSYTYGDSISDPTWSTAVLYVGGSFPSELSSGCQLDGFAIYISTAVADGDVGGVLYGTILGGTTTVASLADYQSLTTADDLLYYNFEEDTLGLDTAGYYDQHLDDFGSPTKTSDHA